MSKVVSYSISASTDYAYINARIRGMKSELISLAQFQDLKTCKNLDEILEILKNTHLSKHFHLLEENPSLSTLEEVFRRDLADTTQSILKLLDGEPRKLFETLLLYWDMEAIRTVLRGKFTNRSSSEILFSTLPVGQLSEPLLKELAESPDLKSVIEILYIWKFPFSRDLFQVLSKFQETQKLIILESALENSFLRIADEQIKKLKQEKEALGEFLSYLKDLFNVRSALRIREEHLPLAQGLSYFLNKGAHIGKSLYTSILQQETSEAACQMISTALGLSQKAKDEVCVERLLEQKVYRESGKAFLGDPLGFDVVFGFLWLKIAEIRNLRIIVRAKIARIPSEKIEEELIHV